MGDEVREQLREWLYRWVGIFTYGRQRLHQREVILASLDSRPTISGGGNGSTTTDGADGGLDLGISTGVSPAEDYSKG
jgi:hypothetical protein